jgi:hypothetical protein
VAKLVLLSSCRVTVERHERKTRMTDLINDVSAVVQVTSWDDEMEADRDTGV